MTRQQWVRSYIINMLKTVLERVERLDQQSCIPRADHPLDTELNEELRGVVRQWAQQKRRECAMDVLLVLHEFAEQSDPDQLIDEILGVQSVPAAEQAQAQIPSTNGQSADDTEPEDGSSDDTSSTDFSLRYGVRAGGSGVVSLRSLRQFLRHHGYRPLKGGNGEQVFSDGMHKISVPLGKGDCCTGTLRKILKRLAQQLECEIDILRGHPVALRPEKPR